MSKRKVVWIINEYAGSPYHGMGVRHYYLARELKNKGYEPYIITASYSHLLVNPKKLRFQYENEIIDGVNYIWIKTIKYSGGTDKKRMLKWFQFSLKLYLLSFKKNIIKKPDYIIASTPEIFHLIPAMHLAKKYKAKFIYEVRDIWPLSLSEIGKISLKHPLIKLMSRIERKAYEESDLVVSVLPNFKDYLRDYNINVKKIEIIPNGICTKELEKLEELPTNIVKGIPKNKFLIAYTGTFGKANALEYLIKAAKILEKHRNIHFLIVGKGEEEKKLKHLTRSLNLKNITFIPPISKKQVINLLINYVDLCYISLKKKDIFKYGVSPNKLFDYMYSGKPIIYAIHSYQEIIKRAKCGITVDVEDPQDIAKGILKLYNIPKEDREKLGINGKMYVLKNHTYKVLGEKLRNALENIN